MHIIHTQFESISIYRFSLSFSLPDAYLLLHRHILVHFRATHMHIFAKFVYQIDEIQKYKEERNISNIRIYA